MQLAASLFITIYYLLFTSIIARNNSILILSSIVSVILLPIAIINSFKVGLSIYFQILVILLTLILTKTCFAFEAKKLLNISRNLLLTYFIYLLAAIYFGYLTPLGFDIEVMGGVNSVMSVMIIMLLFYIANYIRVFETSPLLMPGVAIVFAFLGHGRSGILFATAAFVFALLTRLISKLKSMHYFFLMIFVAICWQFFTANEDAINDLFLGTRLIYGFESEDRVQMVTEYIQSLSGAEILIGGEHGPLAIEHNMNPHNSFIRGHYFFGLPYIFLIFALSLTAVLRGLMAGVKGLAINFFIILFLFRSYYDAVAFPSITDFVFFYLLLMNLCKTRQTPSLEKH